MSVAARRLNMLKNPKNRDAYDAVSWLQREGHQRFQRKVFGPPLLYLGVKDKRLAVTAENCFRESDLLVRLFVNFTNETFTCLCREDYLLMCDLLIDNKEQIFNRRLDIRIVEHSRGNQFDDWRSPCSPEKLKELGFDYFLKDLLTGPPEVINTLCHSNGIQALVSSNFLSKH